MPETSRDPKDDTVMQQYFAHLDREGKVLDWLYGTLIVIGFLALIVNGVLWIRSLISQ